MSNDPPLSTHSPQSDGAAVFSASPARIPIAIVSNSHAPYRLHLHRRIAREIPEIKLWSLYTHETAAWEFEVPEEIGPVSFGHGESCTDQDKPKNAIKEWRRGGRIIRWLKAHDIRFVVMMGYNDPGRIRIIRWCRSQGIPCYLFGDSNIRGDPATGFKAIIKKIIVSKIVRSCAGMFSCGSLGKAYFLKYGARPDRIFYFPYEPDYQLIEQLPAEKIDEACRRFSLQRDRRRIVFSGRLVPVKRVDLLVDAFLSIASQRPEWDLVIIGDGPLRQMLQQKIPADLQSRILWTGFIDDQSTVSGIYRASDVLVLPSDYEPWALVINEAAAAGMAIIASAVVGAAAELVRDGINGRIFAAGKLSELITCLLDVTNATNIDTMKAVSRMVLSDWRHQGDPVDGLRQAMASAAVTS